MSRQFAKSTASLTVLAVGLFCGCQKPMGNAANGPFSPAGTLSPATSQPLIPFNPIGGATRVPPPPTGSTQAINSYSGPTGASASMPMGGPVPYDSFAGSVAPPVGMGAVGTPAGAASLSANSRSNLGGMPVIDLTAGMNTAQNMPNPSVNQAVGSGVASVQPAMNTMPGGDWQPGFAQAGAIQQVPNISVPPGDLASRLRPLDTNVSAGAIPVPGQPVFEPNSSNQFAQTSTGGFIPAEGQSNVAMTQYRSDTNAPTPAWQAVQPASAAANPPYVSQLPTGPSTDPINRSINGSGQSQNQNDSLLWRNPAVAR